MKENALLFSVSLVLAILLWFVAQPIVTESIIKEFDVDVEARNVPEGLELIEMTDQATVIVEGTRDQIDSLQDDDLVAFVDLSGATVDQNSYELQLESPGRYQEFLRFQDPFARATLEEQATKQVGVSVETTGSSPPEFQYVDSTISPAEVTVEGAATNVAEVTKARAVIDLSSIRPNSVFQTEIELLDEQNRPVVNVRAVPAQVEIRPGFEVSRPSRIVAINPEFEGSLPVGFRLAEYELTPTQLEVTGPEDVLQNLGSISTEAIDLRDRTRSETLEVTVRPPEGVEVVGDGLVRIRLVIRRGS